MLCSFILDTKNGKQWDKSDIQVMEGLRSYYSSVEKDEIEHIVSHLSEKFEVNVINMIKNGLK
jgi:hypothetical protein